MSAQDQASASEVNVTPAPAPRPQTTTTEATDSQGVRKLDAEDVKSHGLDPATAKKKSKTAPKSSVPHKAVDSSPVNDLRRIAALVPRVPVKHDAINWFIPNFVMMFNLLGPMCDKVASERPYGDRGTVNDWIPQSSYLVLAVLAIVQTLRAQELAGMLTLSQAHFLKFFVERFPLETITIPGPLVPFFRSLSVASPGFGNFLDVFPAIPPLIINEENFYCLRFANTNAGTTNTVMDLIPHIALMYDQFVHLVRFIASHSAAAPHRYSQYEVLRNLFTHARPGAPGADQNRFDYLRHAVGYDHRPVASDGLFDRFAAHMISHAGAFPAPWIRDDTHAAVAPAVGPPIVAAVAATWTEVVEFSSFMMMDITSNWFNILLRGNERFCSHWKGNSSMLKIHPSTSTAGLILFKQMTTAVPVAPTIFTATILNHCNSHLHMNTSAATTCPFITNEDFEDAQVAQVNCEITGNANAAGNVGITRFGPFWNVAPAVEETAQATIVHQLQDMITSTVFFDAQGKSIVEKVFS